MTLLSAFLVLQFACFVLGTTCPRTNMRPQTECADECHPSKGCYKSNYDCLCDGDCGYSCVKNNLKCRNIRLRDGNVVGSDRNFNATLKFRCNNKYTLFGSLQRRCRANGKWDNKRPRCRIACADPGVPKFAKRNKKESSTGFPENTVLTFYCLPGYRTKTSTSMECQSSGKWSPSSPPACEAKNCGRVVLPIYSEVIRPKKWQNSPTHPYGQRIILRCTSGYRKSGLGVMSCDGSWKLLTRDFHCMSRSCGDPGTPRNGRKIGLAYTFKKVVRYSCDNCYSLEGTPYRQCLANGVWSDSLPSCKPITCADPGRIANGEVLILSKPMYCNSFVEFKCSVGYELKGASRRTCTSDGNWSHSQPTCEIVDCGDPGNPINGQTIARNGFTYAQDISFACYEGYVMVGNPLSTCQDNGQWSKDLPNCLEKCSDPRSSTNAVVMGRKFYHGMRVRFLCSQRNDVLVPMESKELTCVDGTWNGKFPSCKAVCPKTSYIRNGVVNGDGNLEGDQISFTCKQNYVLIGQKILTCRSNRKWSAEKPSCKAPCQKLQRPVNGVITRQGFKHNEEVNFTCNGDYILEGQKVLTCSNGIWSEPTPRCFGPCKKFANNPLLQGYIDQQGFRHGEIATFGCHYPFVIDGESKLSCSNGEWDNDMPSCAEPCPPFSPPVHGQIIKNDTRHREETIFSCNEGYKLVGTSHHICNFGVWSGASPSCKAICQKISEFENGIVKGTGNEEDARLTFQCSSGYALVGPPSITCGSNRQWNGSVPTCKASQLLPQCHNYSNYIRSGSVISKGIPGDKRRFTCRKKFNLVGVREVTCLKTGQWDNPWPKCVYEAKPVKDCSVVSGIKGGFATKNETYHGGKVVFECFNSSYVMVGKKGMRCISGTWNRAKPKCAAPCKAISTLGNGSVNGSETEHRSKIVFWCDIGYSLRGRKILTCNDGSWDDLPPTCVKGN